MTEVATALNEHWYLISIIFVGGIVFSTIGVMQSTQKKMAKDIANKMSKEDCDHNTTACQERNKEDHAEIKKDVREVKSDIRALCVSMGKVEAHMKAANERYRQV